MLVHEINFVSIFMFRWKIIYFCTPKFFHVETSICFGLIITSLSGFTFRNNQGVPEFSIDGGTTWAKLGGSTFRVVAFGTASGSAKTVNFGETIPTDKYMVNISGTTSGTGAGYTQGWYVSSRTTTSVTLTPTYGSNFCQTISYEIIAFN